MSELKYSDLNIDIINSNHKINWNGIEIEILNSLTVSDKYDIVMITLQKSYENGIYNPMLLDMYYHLNLVYMLTNITFSDEDRLDEFKLYNDLIMSGFLDRFLQEVSKVDYLEMQDYIEKIAELNMKYNNSAAGTIRKLVDDLPAQAEAMQSIIENFDKDKYQSVIDFAKAANGGREIK